MNVIIFGTNRGIGLELVKKYINEGHDVTAICRNTSTELEETGAHIYAGVDVTNLDALKKLKLELTNKNFDILIHNAGIWSEESLFDMQEKDFDRMSYTFEVNSIAPLKVVSTFKSLLNTNAKIGLMSSRMGSIADNDSGDRYSYRMSKCALGCAGKSLAIDLKPENIHVAILHPGYVKTDMTGGNGLIDADESAQGLFTVMQNLNANNTGSFWHSNGELLPW